MNNPILAPVASEHLADAEGTAAAVSSTPWADIIAAVLGLRILLTLIGVGITWLLPQKGQEGGLEGLFIEPWNHFDASWFMSIAAHGYHPGLSTAYMPLYPLSLRIVGFVTFGHHMLAALIASNLACVVGVGLLWRWIAELFDTKIAWRAITVYLLFPDSFYLLGAYSESLFLVFSAGCLLALRRERRWTAAVLATLATLTRLQGLVLIVPILVALAPLHRQRLQLIWGLCAAALPGVVLLAYQRLLMDRVGSTSVIDTFQNQWKIPIQTPWQTLWRYVEKIRSPEWHLIHSPKANYVLLWDLLIALAVLTVLIMGARKLGWELTVFGLASWCFALTRWFSTGRYMLAVLPFFIAVAVMVQDRKKFQRLTMGSLLLLVFFTAEFVQNSWVD